MLPGLTAGHRADDWTARGEIEPPACEGGASRSPYGRLRSLAFAGLLVAALAACGGSGLQSGQGNQARLVLPTPMSSLTPTVAATASLLRGALEDVGLRLEPAVAQVRPSEPESLTTAPRAALRASLADPAEGFVVIYDLADAAEARQRAADLAEYLRSGFGLSNYASDTRFSVAVVDDTLVFAWWSPSRSSDRESGEAAFDALARVGDPIEVVR